MSLMQKDNVYIHLKDGEQTVLYIELKPTIDEETIEFLRKLVKDFLEKFGVVDGREYSP